MNVRMATGLPIGISFTVTENINDGYTVESQNESEIISTEHTSVKFNNILSKVFKYPESSDNSNIPLWLSICILSTIAIIVSVIPKYNKKS